MRIYQAWKRVSDKQASLKMRKDLPAAALT